MKEFSDMKNVAIIGVGNLGIRHLQSLASLPHTINLYAVDSFENSLVNAKHSIASAELNHNIYFLNNLNDLPGELDLVVIATGANVRLGIIQELLKKKIIKFLILEKVLFQNTSEYEICNDLLASIDTKVYVNCPRRMYPAYKRIKEAFCDDEILQISIVGGNWGIGCNGIHFIDLYTFLTKRFIDTYKFLLDKKLYDSKRAGFFEYSGLVCGQSDGVELLMSCKINSHPSYQIQILSRRQSCIIDESLGSMIIYEEGKLVTEEKIELPYQSALTSIVASELFSSGECQLTKYFDSTRLHVPFIDGLFEFTKKYIDPNIYKLEIT